MPRLIEFGPVLLEKKTLNFVNVFFLFCYYLPLKRAWPFIRTKLNPLHSRMLCDKFDWIWSRSSGEEDENVTSLQTVRCTDQQRTTGDQKSSFELPFQVRLKVQLLHCCKIWILDPQSASMSFNWLCFEENNQILYK